MKGRRLVLFIGMSICAVLISCAGSSTSEQNSKQSVQDPEPAMRKINITGKIIKTSQGYVIRGKVPREVFRIVNPDADILDEFAAKGTTIYIEARIILGDNVEIDKINGEDLEKK